jgi:aspartate aminotransferase
MVLTERVNRIKESPTLAVTAKAKAMRAQGVDVIGFGAGEPDFDTPENIKRAAQLAMKNGFTKYTPVGGIDQLKDAVIERIKEDSGLSYSRSEVMISCGAKHALYNISQALFQEGDSVVIPAPCWVTYPDQVELAGAKALIVGTTEETGFKPTSAQWEEAMAEGPKAVLLNSPCNPTGSVFSRQELQEVATLAVEKDALIIADEIYGKIIYDDAEHVSIGSLGEEVKQRTLLVDGVSKTYSMTGWRIGYVAGPSEVISAMNKLQSQSTSNPTSISQMASVEALTGPQDAVREMVDEFRKRRDYMCDRLNAIPGISCLKPLGAFYTFPNVSALFGKSYDKWTIGNSGDLATYLLEHARVAVVSGEAFCADGYMRLSYATSMENISNGLDRLEEAVGKLS